MTRKTVDRAAAVRSLAPAAPPCFSSRAQWIEYAIEAASDQRPGRPSGPLVIERGEAGFVVRFNHRFGFCAECTDQHEAVMRRAGRCQPTHLLRLIEQAKEIA